MWLDFDAYMKQYKTMKYKDFHKDIMKVNRKYKKLYLILSISTLVIVAFLVMYIIAIFFALKWHTALLISAATVAIAVYTVIYVLNILENNEKVEIRNIHKKMEIQLIEMELNDD